MSISVSQRAAQALQMISMDQPLIETCVTNNRVFPPTCDSPAGMDFQILDHDPQTRFMLWDGNGGGRSRVSSDTQNTQSLSAALIVVFIVVFMPLMYSIRPSIAHCPGHTRAASTASCSLWTPLTEQPSWTPVPSSNASLTTISSPNALSSVRLAPHSLQWHHHSRQ